jgi:hypothetical protein
MPYSHHENDQLVVAELAKDPIVPDAITPKALFVPDERLAATAGTSAAISSSR